MKASLGPRNKHVGDCGRPRRSRTIGEMPALKSLVPLFSAWMLTSHCGRVVRAVEVHHQAQFDSMLAAGKPGRGFSWPTWCPKPPAGRTMRGPSLKELTATAQGLEALITSCPRPSRISFDTTEKALKKSFGVTPRNVPWWCSRRQGIARSTGDTSAGQPGLRFFCSTAAIS